jgi:hypothetical protein
MDWIAEHYSLHVPSGPLTQGDVWGGLPFEHFGTSSCIGILITPRCDLAHAKTPVVNFLPLVSIEEFFERWGGFELLEQEKHNAHEALVHTAQQLGVGDAIELGLPRCGLIRDLERDRNALAAALGVPRARVDRNISDFEEQSRALEKIESCIAKPELTYGEITNLVSEKAIKRYKLQVAGNRVADVHFLPPCPRLLEQAMVVLMRQIFTLSTNFLRAAERCISAEDWQVARQSQPGHEFAVAATKPERLLRVKSPYLEALMARFCALFGRVGVRDIPTHQLEKFTR